MAYAKFNENKLIAISRTKYPSSHQLRRYYKCIRIKYDAWEDTSYYLQIFRERLLEEIEPRGETPSCQRSPRFSRLRRIDVCHAASSQSRSGFNLSKGE